MGCNLFSNKCCPKHNQRGFTLVELVIVIILLGILSVVALPRILDADSFESFSLRGTVLSSLKLAQKAALSQHGSSVYWVLRRLPNNEWQVQILMRDTANNAVLPNNVTPASVAPAFVANTSIGYRVNLTAGGTLNTLALPVNQNLVVLYNQLGDMIEVAQNVALNNPAAFPFANDAANRVSSSLTFNDNRGNYCLSLSGYSYEAQANCR